MSEDTQQKQLVKEPEDKYAKLNFLGMPHEPHQVKDLALKELEDSKDGKFSSGMDSPIVRAMTLREFNNGLLMTTAVDDQYKTFAIQMSLDLQKQYKCDTVGKKSLAEITALNYCRVLESQRKLNNFLGKESYGDLTVKILAVLSKEQDRAQRHYLTSIQALEMGLQQPINVSIKTNTANIASQQAIQQVGEQTNVKG